MCKFSASSPQNGANFQVLVKPVNKTDCNNKKKKRSEDYKKKNVKKKMCPLAAGRAEEKKAN